MATMFRRPGGCLAALSALTLSTAACAGAGGGAGGAATAGPAKAAAARAEPARVASGQLAPARPGAASYGPGDGKCPPSPAVAIVMQELAAASKGAGRLPPELDPRLCAIAETFLGWDPAAQGNPRLAVLQFVSSHHGLPVTVMPPVVAVIGPLPASASSESANEQLIAERIVKAVASTVANAAAPRVGIAMQRSRRGKSDVAYKVSVAIADVPVELEPLPRRLELGQQATLSGRLVGGVKDPKVFVSDAAGQLSAPEQPPGEAFKAEVRCGDRPGRIQVEVRGEYEGRSGAVASFPVLCGTAPPASVALAGAAWPGDVAAAERRILELVNEERVAAGLKPLEFDAAVAGVARGISAEIAARGGAGGGDVGERLRKEGIASPLVLQSAVAERSFERAHDRLMASPTNRANLMNPDVTNAGVGAFTKTDSEGHPLVYVTEVFVKELPAADAKEVRQQLRDAVARKRKDARTNPLADHPVLDEVAQRFAEAVAQAGGTLPKEQQTALTSPLNKAFKTVTMVSGAKQEPLDFAEEPQTTAPGKSLGVGVAQGQHPVLGRNATYVVLMVGTPRAGTEAAPAKRKGK